MLTYVEFDKPVSDYCEASSLSFGANSRGNGVVGGASHAAQRNDVEFTKNRDSLSEAIMRHCAVGTVFGTVWVELYRDADSDVFATYTLGSVVITSVQPGKNGESVALNYQTMKGEYFAR